MDIRLRYEKKGLVRYISHLDMNRLMQRAIARSGLPVWYTEGFNPHVYITFLQPLSLGFTSAYEIMDMRLTEELSGDEAMRRLNAVLPEGVAVLSCGEPVMKPKDMAFSVYEVTLAAAESERALSALYEMFKQESITVLKKSKRGERMVDIRPMLSLVSAGVAGEGIKFTLRCQSGGEQSVNPSLPVAELVKRLNLPEAEADYLRISITNSEGTPFF